MTTPKSTGWFAKFHDVKWAWAILFASLVLTAMAWWLSNNYLHNRASDRFQFRIDELSKAINDRMIEYQQVLRGAVGLYRSSSEVTRQEWHDYISSQELEEPFPGFQGIGVAEFVRPEQKKQFVKRIQQQGFPKFDIKPQGDRDLYSAIVYLEPFDWRNQRAFGYDMYSNPVRREAMDRAIETGEPSMSGKVVLVQETEVETQQGFLLYLPIDQTDTVKKPDVPRGLVYAVFRAGDLMDGIVRSELDAVRFKVFDGDEIGDQHLLYNSEEQAHSTSDSPLFEDTRRLHLQGRTWTLLVESKSGFVDSAESWLSAAVAGVGLVVDILLFLVISAIGRQRRNATELAEKMTSSYRQTIVELERSNRDLDDFAYVASHDLRSPLRNIDSLANWVIEDSGDSLPVECRHHLDRMKLRIDRLDRLLSDLLTYSRAGRLEEKLEVVDSRKLVDEIVDSLSKPDDFTFTLHGTFPQFETLKQPLETCLRNLIDNAIKHHDHTNGCVEVSTRKHETYYCFSVSDNGPGIDPQFHERVFKVFQTLKGDGVEASSSGAGLAIVKKTVRAYGGFIELHSAKGSGATFELFWPVVIRNRESE